MSVEEQLNLSEAYTPLQRMRHSAAHVMAEAVQDLFPDAQFAIGPAIEDGFYYDMALPRPLTPEDFPAIEERMRASIAADHPFVQSRWPREQALAYFREHDQPFKIGDHREPARCRGRHLPAGAVPRPLPGAARRARRARSVSSS